MTLPLLALALLATLALAPHASQPDDSAQLLTIDHYVTTTSTVPAIAGERVALYARERVLAGRLARAADPDRVVIFVHGAGTPAEVAFDVPYQDYSWMAYLANAGYDVFAMDTTGYGRSVRPAAMNDPCNLAKDRQVAFVSAPCAPTHPSAMTTIASDWADIGAVVDYVRALRRVDKVSLIGWSLGGPRAGGYAAQHPEKVHKLVLLAPAYNRTAPAAAPATRPAGAAFNTQTRAEFDANWERQLGCSGQQDPRIADVVWREMLASDPVGATWGPGVRRAPQTTTWGWNSAMVAKTTAPALLIAGIHDRQVPPQRVQELFADLGAKEKVLLDLGCASHNAMWETHRLLLFKASLEWLRSSTITGAKDGLARLGY